MLDQYSEIGDILAKHPDLTLEEDTLLKDWINQSDNNRKIFEELSSPSYLVNKLQRFEQIQSGKGGRWLRVQDAINAAHKKVFRLRKWRTYMAAASIIIIMVLIGVKWFGEKKAPVKEKTPVVVHASDVAPGKFKAKLTLADGSVIVLDSFNNSKLVQQGSTTVYTKDGKLIYKQKGKQNEVLYNTLSTSKAQTYATVLSDGSKVWLNSESSIHYPVAFDRDIRKVEITGETYFEIAHDASKPFIVAVNGTEIKVLGTKFNVNAYADEGPIRTTLLEGSVQVKKGIGHTTIKPGQQAQVANNTIKTIDHADVEQAVAWKNGFFNFDGQDIPTALRQIARWYNINVVYEGEIPRDKFMGEVERNLSLSQALKIMERAGLQFTVEGRKLIVKQQ